MYYSVLDDINRLPLNVRKLVQEFMKQDIINRPCGKYGLVDERYFIIMESCTKEPEKLNFEAHSKYGDIQIVLSGSEIIEYLPGDAEVVLKEDRLEKDDVAFYTSADTSVPLLLKPGRVAVFYPGELHKPGCNSPRKETVRKAVIKF